MSEKVLVLYGGVNPEHEVSIVTALQVMNALKEADYEVIPGYISKQGSWYLGDRRFLEPELYKDLSQVKSAGKQFILSADRRLRLLEKGWLGFGGSSLDFEVVFPVFHGRAGEDGSMAGLLELSGAPYVGCGVVAGSVGVDKYVAKRVAKSLGIKVLPDRLVSKEQWQEEREKVEGKIKELGLPVYVKPVGLGSSIGLSRVEEWGELGEAIEVALAYDQRVLVEQGLEEPQEVNISLLGNGPYQVSVTEEPISSGQVLSFEDKYLREGGKKQRSEGMASAERVMPAKVSEEMIERIEQQARRIFAAIDGKGIARVDFMVEEDQLYFNELNTMPGSLAFFLWEEVGIEFTELVTRLIELAKEDWKSKDKLVTTFESNILAGFSRRGLKGKGG